MRRNLVFRVTRRLRDLDRSEAITELAKLPFELRDLALLPVNLVAELEIRMILMRDACLEILETRGNAGIF
jgi:hypothetical protein